MASPRRFPEQRFGGGAVSGRLAPMRCHPRDFGFEQGDAFIQFRLRIGPQILCREVRGRISFGAGAIGLFHRRAASQVKRLAVNRQGGYLPLPQS